MPLNKQEKVNLFDEHAFSQSWAWSDEKLSHPTDKQESKATDELC